MDFSVGDLVLFDISANDTELGVISEFNRSGVESDNYDIKYIDRTDTDKLLTYSEATNDDWHVL